MLIALKLLILIVARRAKKAALPNDGYNLGTVNSFATRSDQDSNSTSERLPTLSR